MRSGSFPRGIGVFVQGTSIFLLSHDQSAEETKFFFEQSHDGVHFATEKTPVILHDVQRKLIDPASVVSLHIATVPQKLGAVMEQETAKGREFAFATAQQVHRWTVVARAPYITDSCVLVSDYQKKDHSVCYTGGKRIGLMESQDLKDWMVIDSDIMPEGDAFTSQTVAWAGQVDGEIVLFYFGCQNGGLQTHYCVHWAVFSIKDPSGLLRKSDTPIWESSDDWDGVPFAVAVTSGVIISYWNSEKRGVFAISHGPLSQVGRHKAISLGILTRIKDNPILSPIAKHFWESKAVFNPAAVYSRGKVHLIYRAIGDTDVSVLGYAASSDGVHIDERLKSPIFMPTLGGRGVDSPMDPVDDPPAPPNGLYVSGGGGWGGSEDPRITEIDGRMYLTYVAFDGWSAPRVALTSISSDDFHAHRWNWTTPKLISPPGMVDKNAVLFPEKIYGKYVMLHRIFPNIYVDFLDDLSFEGKQKWLGLSRAIAPTRFGWDSRKVGAGAPPIKTDDGWLLIYHAVGESDSGRYKIGAMLLDTHDPSKVLYRSQRPILAPDAWYENEGYKAGVVYPCGAVAVGDRLMVYYGGADQVACVATAPMHQFLQELKTTGSATVTAIHDKRTTVSG